MIRWPMISPEIVAHSAKNKVFGSDIEKSRIYLFANSLHSSQKCIISSKLIETKALSHVKIMRYPASSIMKMSTKTMTLLFKHTIFV